jgi:hydroxymethylbilane synthase
LASGLTLRIATRGSALARWQAEEVARLLRLAHPALTVELVLVQTTGDRRHDLEVWELGGQGVFVKEVQAAVLQNRADMAVHSAKDLPSSTAAGLVLAAFPARADERDALVGSRLDDLAPGALVATGSVRRRAQLAWLRPDLTFTGLRGNVPTRMDRVPEGGAVVVAAAALERLGLSDRAAEVLDVGIMLPQVAQGAIAVECRAEDAATIERLSSIDDPGVRVAVTAERAFLARLGSGCDLPVGAHATWNGAGRATLEVDGMLASRDGRMMLRSTISGRRPMPAEAADLGARLASELLDAGGRELLDLAPSGEGEP